MAESALATNLRISEEDSLRAQYYRLLARFLAGPADKELLRATAALEGDDTELGRALNALAGAAATAAPAAADEEYHDLFIGVGRGELVPFGSFYMAGFLYEKPLAKLRADMARLGIERAADVCEPEDHMASVCDMMAGLIVGEFGPPLDLAGQRSFFEAHLAPWASTFFEDMEGAKAAVLYRPVGTIGRLFIGIETVAFEMTA